MLITEPGDAVIQKGIPLSLTRGSSRDARSAWPDILSTKMEQVRQLSGVEQALQMFRNFRKSARIRKTKMFCR